MSGGYSLNVYTTLQYVLVQLQNLRGDLLAVRFTEWEWRWSYCLLPSLQVW